MSQRSIMLGLWGNIVFLFCIISNTDALQFRPWLPGDYDSQGHALRALEGPKCWYPNYYCSVTAANTQTPTVVTGGASTCYDKCNGDGTCKFFTWFKRRGVEYCYLLTECGKDYQIYDDWCTARESCFSGPSDCSTVSNNNTVCAKLDTASDLIEWQCENGGTGLYLNGYNGTLATGARCMLSCASWQSFRWAAKSAVTYPEKGFIFSTCQADGSWSDVLPNDFKDDKTSLEWPRPSDLHRTTYPKPNEGSISCGCSDLVLAWPPQQNASLGLEAFYYNPRDEEGATMECEDEVQNSEVALTNEFRIKSNNTCRFLCDNILVATVKCSDGKWTGEVDRGFWCYEYPKEENMLKNYLKRMTPRNGSMSSEESPEFGIDNCIFEPFSGSCETDGDPDPKYKWMAVEMDCVAVIQQIKFTFHDLNRGYMETLKVIIANNVPTTDMVPFEDGETVATYDGPTITEEGYVWNKRIENPVPGKTVVFQIKKDGPPGRMSARSIELFGTCSTD